MPNYHLASWSWLLIHKFGIAGQAALQVFVSPGITYIKAWAGTTATDTERKQQLLWLKGELSLWGLFAHTAGMGATGHGQWHFLLQDECLSNGRRGETIHVLQHHMPLGLAGRDQGWMQLRCCHPFWCWGYGMWYFSYHAIFEQKALLQEACDYWRTSTFTDFKKALHFETL